jgi:hypothetical protein
MSVFWHSVHPPNPPRTGSRPRHRTGRRTGAALAAVAALVLGSGACSGGQPGGAAPAPASTPARDTARTQAPAAPALPRVDRLPEIAVRRAYLRSWDDYARAVWRLDPRGLEATYAGSGLEDIEVEVDQRVRSRRRSRVAVTHDLSVVLAGADHAVVVDRVDDSSRDVDADTGADLGPTHPRPAYYQMTLQRFRAGWKVVFVHGE